MTYTYEVFICYETTTSLDLAANVKEALRKVNISAFVAQIDIPVSEDWEAKIDKCIDECKHLVVIITNVALFSNDVIREVNLAKEMGKRIIPCIHKSIRKELLEKITPFDQLMNIQGVVGFDDKYELSRLVVAALLKNDYYLYKELEIIYKRHAKEAATPYGEMCIESSAELAIENMNNFIEVTKMEESYSSIFEKFKKLMLKDIGSKVDEKIKDMIC